MVDSGLNHVFAADTAATIVASTVGAVGADAAPVLVIASSLASVDVLNDTASAVLERVAVTGRVTMNGGANLRATSSYLGGGVFLATTSGGQIVKVFHCVLASSSGPAIQNDVTFANATQHITAVNSVFVAPGALAITVAIGPQGQPVELLLAGNDLFTAGAAPLQIGDAPPLTLADVNACTGVCDAGTGSNVDVNPGFATVFHTGVGSALRNAAPVLATDFGAPPSVAVDFDGACRYQDGAADIGADEAAP